MSVGDGCGWRSARERVVNHGADDLGDGFFDVNGSVELPCGFRCLEVCREWREDRSAQPGPELDESNVAVCEMDEGIAHREGARVVDHAGDRVGGLVELIAGWRVGGGLTWRPDLRCDCVVHDVFERGPVAIEGRFGDPGAFDDRCHGDASNAEFDEEIHGGVEHPGPCSHDARVGGACERSQLASSSDARRSSPRCRSNGTTLAKRSRCSALVSSTWIQISVPSTTRPRSIVCTIERSVR